MPELPDVQVLKELVDATLLHRPIDDVMLREEMVEEVSPQEVRTVSEQRDLGPDAMDLDREAFRKVVTERAGTIKGTLMSQDSMAGLDNIYVDEILFHAGIHPETQNESLSHELIDRLFDAMHEAVEGAVDARADPEEMPDDWLLPHREQGASSSHDDGKLEKIEVSGRPTFVCPEHQERVG